MRNRPTNKKRNRYAALCGLAMGTAIGTSIAITQRMARHHRMPNLKTWRRALIEKHGEVQGAILAARAQARYEALYNERPRFTHPALRWHLEQNILPGLALYQVLSKENIDRDAVLSETGSLLAIGSRALTKFVNMYRYLPLPFLIMRQIFRASLLAFPQQGWDIDQIEQSERSFAFTIHRCFYLDVLTAYGAPELTAMYCRLDDLLYAAWSPSIRWERTKTLGRGDDCCDFRWSRVEPGHDTTGLIQVQPRVKRGNVSSLSK
ncbi:MAG TPA: L-2-amino-thiazoline-4-carboxylic acid hydrolase [Ktedonobacteraceae bacterium]